MAISLGGMKLKQIARRSFFCLSFVFSIGSTGAAVATPLDITVMTQNLYIGADTLPLLQSPDPATLQAVIQSVMANNFPARAGAIANEVVQAGGPLLIGLQEAVVLSSPFGTLDYTQILLDQLASHGLSYQIAGVHQGLTVSIDGFSSTDREVVLARTGVPGFTATGQGFTFLANVPLPTLPATVVASASTFDRGYVLVNATLNSQPFEFVSTHLDEFHTIAQPLQAQEILTALATIHEPQLVVGDFNANPTQSAYAEMLAAGFIDTAAVTGAVGPTCCQAADLDNAVSLLRNRFDYVFERDFSSIDAAFLVGNTPFENVRPRWPSDHAGVVATVDVPEPSTATILFTGILLLGIRLFRVRRWAE